MCHFPHITIDLNRYGDNEKQTRKTVSYTNMEITTHFRIHTYNIHDYIFVVTATRILNSMLLHSVLCWSFDYCFKLNTDHIKCICIVLKLLNPQSEINFKKKLNKTEH